MVGREKSLTSPDERGDENVVILGQDSAEEPPPKGPRPSRAHGIGIAGMAISALVGIVAVLAFVSVRWPDDSGRFLIGTVFLCAVAFMAFSSIAVFSAARDTYPRRSARHGRENEEQ